MNTAKQQIQEFKNEWFPFVYEWEDAPNTIYDEHFHKWKTALYTIDGDIEFEYTDTNEVHILKKWDLIYPELKRPHKAKVGPHGWRVVVAEMIDWDS